ncbi:hypothetical protein SAMN05216345_104446 [Cupriavidus sp. YR651]|uniref:hypothetical protein n=1 Tax=Cupriavidus sp. YR651 TaxID=1855315 RepID=UPI000886A02F|nr:hypothetical protein [Cupriavidus sp. YR651]SDC91745.1 hypothetical protein SAMN05216345_104446 [Cupriavidus sp. YR651]
MQNKKLNLAPLIALIALTLSPLARADVSEAAHDVKEGTVHAVKKTGEFAKDVGHGIGHAAKTVGHGIGQAAKTVGHGVADTTREGYHAVKHAVHKDSEQKDPQ